MAPQGLPPLAHHEGAALGQRQIPADRLQLPRLLLRSEERKAAPESRRSRSRAPSHLREARHLAKRAEDARRRRGRCDLRQRLGWHDDEGGAQQARNRLLLIRRSGADPSRSRREVPRNRRSTQRQLLRCAQRSSVQRWFVCLRTKGCEVPDGAFDVLPHQHQKHRPVRAHTDYRRRRRFG